MTLNKRQTLTRLVSCLFFLMIIFFCYVYFKGVLSSSIIQQNSTATLFDQLAIGETKLMRVNNQISWVTKLSEPMKATFLSFNNTTVGGHHECVLQQQVCVVNAQTKTPGILLSYLKERPRELEKADWYGGLINPKTGELYDLFGRKLSLARK